MNGFPQNRVQPPFHVQPMQRMQPMQPMNQPQFMQPYQPQNVYVMPPQINVQLNVAPQQPQMAPFPQPPPGFPAAGQQYVMNQQPGMFVPLRRPMMPMRQPMRMAPGMPMYQQPMMSAQQAMQQIYQQRLQQQQQHQQRWPQGMPQRAPQQQPMQQQWPQQPVQQQQPHQIPDGPYQQAPAGAGVQQQWQPQNGGIGQDMIVVGENGNFIRVVDMEVEDAQEKLMEMREKFLNEIDEKKRKINDAYGSAHCQ